jgi:hypothetical protein
MRNHYARRENPPRHRFPVTRIMPVSSLRSAVLPLVARGAHDGNEAYFALSKLTELRRARWCCRSDALGNQHTTWTFPSTKSVFFWLPKACCVGPKYCLQWHVQFSEDTRIFCLWQPHLTSRCSRERTDVTMRAGRSVKMDAEMEGAGFQFPLSPASILRKKEKTTVTLSVLLHWLYR